MYQDYVHKSQEEVSDLREERGFSRGHCLPATEVTQMKEIDLNFAVSRLGEGQITSPITGVRFVNDEEHVLYHSDFRELKGYLDAGIKPPCLEKALGRARWMARFSRV